MSTHDYYKESELNGEWIPMSKKEIMEYCDIQYQDNRMLREEIIKLKEEIEELQMENEWGKTATLKYNEELQKNKKLKKENEKNVNIIERLWGKNTYEIHEELKKSCEDRDTYYQRYIYYRDEYSILKQEIIEVDKILDNEDLDDKQMIRSIIKALKLQGGASMKFKQNNSH